METLSIVLHAATPSLSNEFSDVMKLFCVVESFRMAEEEGAEGESLVQSYREENGEAYCRFTFRNSDLENHCTLPAPETDEAHYAIVRKRVQKRLCKRTLYELMKRLTGHKPPWGSLTGIRPTRLVYEGLASGLSMDESVMRMQTAFDVSPEKAELLRRIVLQQQTLSQPTVQEADVYISIPFCRTRCAYCSFPGEALGKGRMVEPYLAALFAEMEAGAALLKASGLSLRALYIGGGTPSALNEEDFARLMEKTMLLYPGAMEYTVEAGRPDTITKAKLETLQACGAGRISINPQTMNDETLRIIGRDHNSHQTIEAFELARQIGFTDINMDVIAGLPGEKTSHFEHTMQEILRLAPDSLTVHTLAIKRTSRLNLERWPLPDGQIASEMVELGEETADRLGMEPYYLYRQKYMAGQQQNVGYARPGCACLYNVDIMEETASILAMGAGAISKRVFPDRELRIERAPNVSNVSVYIERVQDMIGRKNDLFA